VPPERSIHTRPLPDGLVALSSKQGRRRFSESLSSGSAEAYFPLAEQFVTQSEVTFCGLASLTMCMNALRVDPMRIWKDRAGPGWRWWADEMFATSCSDSIELMKQEGIDMDQFHLMALANGAQAEMRRTSDDEGGDVGAFRQRLLESAQMDEQAFVVVSFDRAALGQTGGGHFSPIGGYHAPSDSVLVLDVARFKYPPYWVPVAELWEACAVVDPSTGRARGWFTLEAWTSARDDDASAVARS